MPKLHLTKVAFACRDVDSLRDRIASRAKDGQVRVATRLRPKRSAELIGGSLYWIVKHRLVACQMITGFEDRADGRLDIVCSADLQLIVPMPRRAHQGWRYFEFDESAVERDATSGLGDLPTQLYSRLRELALV